MKPNSLLIILSAITLLVSFWNRNDIPGHIETVPALANEPQQTPTRERPFDVAFNDVSYEIRPEYDYDITGMVVSYRHHHEDNSRMHALAKDHLNMLDACVIWGCLCTSSGLIGLTEQDWKPVSNRLKCLLKSRQTKTR
jgi:hypothetical protein